MIKLCQKILPFSLCALLCLFLASFPAAAQPDNGGRNPLGDQLARYILNNMDQGAKDSRLSSQNNHRGDNHRHDGRGMRGDPRNAPGHDSYRHDRRDRHEYDRGYDRGHDRGYNRDHDRGYDRGRPKMRRDGRPDHFNREPGNRDFRGQNPRPEPERNFHPGEGRGPGNRGHRFGGPDRRPEF